jgi:hypothetical protein
MRSDSQGRMGSGAPKSQLTMNRHSTSMVRAKKSPKNYPLRSNLKHIPVPRHHLIQHRIDEESNEQARD